MNSPGVVAYEGTPPDVVEAIDGHGARRPIRHIVRRSPTGLAWGYGGSGPADLALAILADHLGYEPTSHIVHDFKWQIVAQLPADQPFYLAAADIERWLLEHGQTETLRRRRRALAVLAANEDLHDIYWLTDSDLAAHRYAAVATYELRDLDATRLERLLTVHATHEEAEQTTAGAAASMLVDLDAPSAPV